jgi:hypothetical protein
MNITNIKGHTTTLFNIRHIRPKRLDADTWELEVSPIADASLRPDEYVPLIAVTVTPAEIGRIVQVAPHLFTSPERAREIAARTEQVENGPNVPMSE